MHPDEQFALREAALFAKLDELYNREYIVCLGASRTCGHLIKFMKLTDAKRTAISWEKSAIIWWAEDQWHYELIEVTWFDV